MESRFMSKLIKSVAKTNTDNNDGKHENDIFLESKNHANSFKKYPHLKVLRGVCAKREVINK